METATKSKTCSACAYWNDKTGSMGECRVRSPQSIVFKVDDETKFESRFPETKASDWCGEFQPR